MNDETMTTDTQSALDAGMALARVLDINGVPAVLLPNGAQLEALPQLAIAPQRIQRTITLDTAESFVDYYNQFADASSKIFCDLVAARFVAVIDYPLSAEATDWCEHIAVYQCPKTVEWQDWRGLDGRPQNQTEFAQFIEDHLPDIVDPPGAQMLEIAKTLHAVKGVNFRKAIRLDNGQNQIVYEEKIEGSAGEKGEFQIPTTFKIGVRLFEGGTAYKIEARLRYRINETQLALWYELVRPHKVHEDAVLGVLEFVKEHKINGSVLRGKWAA